MKFFSILIAFIIASFVLGVCDYTLSECPGECLTEGFTQIQGAGKCILDFACTDKKCNGDGKVQACLTKGFVADTNDMCVPPTGSDCESGKSSCSINQNYCVSYLGYVHNPSNGSCVMSTDNFCETANTSYCLESKMYCVAIMGYYQREDGQCQEVDYESCVVDSGRCQKPYTSCASHFGLIKINNEGTCGRPDYDQCITPGTTLCKSDKNFCLSDLGLKKSTNDGLCAFPSVTECQNDPNYCSYEQMFCTVKRYFNQGCVAPKQSECIADRTTKCDNPESYCLLTYGLIKSNDAGQCAVPTPELCTKSSTTLCLDPSSPCIKTLGLLKSNQDGLCGLPSYDDCIKPDNTLCADPQSYCLSLGFKKSGNAGLCVAPIDSECVNDANPSCNDPKLYCSAILGYVKDNNGVCVPPKSADCIKADTSLCIDTKSYCVKTLGYPKNSVGPCIPSDAQCLEKTNLLCQDDKSHCLTTLAFNKGTAGICVAPEDCKQASKGYCSDTITYCKSQGYSKGSSNDCVCDTTTNTEANQKCTKKNNVQATTAMLIKTSFAILFYVLIL